MVLIFSLLIVFIESKLNKTNIKPNSIPFSIQNNEINESNTEDICTNNISTKLLNSTHEYTFKGEKFEFFGIFTFFKGKFIVFLDGEKIETKNIQNKNECSLQYSSENLQYSEHKVKITCISFKICNFYFWPSIDAFRINGSDLNSNFESKRNNIKDIKNFDKIKERILLIKCSKIWIYGSITNQSNFDRFLFSIDKDRFSIDGKSILNIKNDGLFFYETKILEFKKHEIKFQINGSAQLYCIYYLSNINKMKKNRDEFSKKIKNFSEKKSLLTHYYTKSHYFSSKESNVDISLPVDYPTTNLCTDVNSSKSGHSIFNDYIERKTKISKQKIVILILSFEIFIVFILLIIVIVLLIQRIVGPIEESNDIPLVILY